MNNFQLRQNILNFSLDDGPRGNQGYSRVLLQLFGYTGHGKSSFINSCMYVINSGENFEQFAVAGQREDGGAMTLVRKAYDLTGNITIVDNRGFTKMNSFERAEIYAQLGNFIPPGEPVEWTDNFTDMMHRMIEAEVNTTYTDFIVPILVYSATNSLPDNETQEVKTFLTHCVKMTGIFPIIVITKKTQGDFIETEKAFQRMGAEVIIPIENYTVEDHIKTQGRTRDILMIIHNALDDVRFRLGEEERNPRADWVKHKKFLLDYVYKADQEKKAEKQQKLELQREVSRRTKGVMPFPVIISKPEEISEQKRIPKPEEISELEKQREELQRELVKKIQGRKSEPEEEPEPMEVQVQADIKYDTIRLINASGDIRAERLYVYVKEVKGVQIDKEPQIYEVPQIVKEPQIYEVPQIVKEPQIDKKPQIDKEPQIVKEPQIDKEPQIYEKPQEGKKSCGCCLIL